MKINKVEKRVLAGVDGCPGGWFMVQYDGNKYIDSLYKNIDQLAGAIGDKADIWIDMPIGLGSATINRTVDQLLRKAIPGKSSSVFTPPCREAMGAGTYQEANRINRGITGKGLTIQSWNIVQKINELDRWIRNNQHSKIHFCESFPELCFQALNGGQVIGERKSSPEGLKKRIDIIQSKEVVFAQLYETVLNKYPRSMVRKDDILDAMALLQCNRQSTHEGYKFLNDPVGKDEYGIPMRIAWPGNLQLPVQ